MAKRILIVDDDPAQRRILEECIKRFGYETRTAASGEQALQIMTGPERSDIALVLLDLVDAAPMRQSALLADAPNLLNVSVSRARGKLVIVADVAYFEATAPNGIVAALLRAARVT